MEEDLSCNAQTRNVPQRRRWYTRLWPSCLGCRCIHRQRRQKFPLFLIGYDPTGPLQRAASVGDFDTTDRLIHSGQHHVDESDRRSRTSLHYACAHNHPDVVLLLLENNSNINIRDDEGCTPLIKAAQRDNIHCVSVLLDHNADPNVMDFSGNTAFHHAVCRGNLPIVKMLLKNKVDIEAKTEYGLTPLQLAAFERKPEMVEFLEAMCAKAHAPVEINGSHIRTLPPASQSRESLCHLRSRAPEKSDGLRTGTPAQKTGVKHVSFNEEVFYFKDEKPLSRRVRPRGPLKSILKYSSQYNTATDRTTRRRSLWCTKGDNVRYTSLNKEESNKTLHRLQKRMRKFFTKSEVYVCSQGEPIPDLCEEKASIMVKGNKPENFHHVPQEHKISMPQAPVDVEPSPSTSAAVIGATIGIESTPSQRGPGDIDQTSFTTATDIEAAGDTEPIPSTSADSGPIADVEPMFYLGLADISESDETHDSETASDTELDSISDLAVYMEHARDTPWADPEPTSGPYTCYSLDSTEGADLNNLTLLKEAKYDSFSLDKELTTVPDLDEHLAPTRDANVFYDNLPLADHTGHSKTTVRGPGYLLEQEILLMLLMPFLWFLAYLLSMIAGMRNLIRRVWHKENGQGPPTNRKEGSVAAAADHPTLEAGDTTH